MAGTLTVTFDNRVPVLSWTPYIPYPSGYHVYWSTGPEGPWERLNGADALLVAQYRDELHVLTTERRIYWKVTAVIGAVEVEHVAPTLWAPALRSDFVSNVLGEIERRHNLMMTKVAGESCTVYLRLAAGDPCPTCTRRIGDGTRVEYEGPLCPTCYNTGIVGGYRKLENILIRVRNAQEMVEQTVDGFRLSEARTAWLPNYPVLDVSDFFERPNGERFIIGSVRRRELQGYLTLQVCNLVEVEPEHPIYDIEIS